MCFFNKISLEKNTNVDRIMDFNRVEYKWYSLGSRIGPRFADCYSAVTRNPKYAEHQADIAFLS